MRPARGWKANYGKGGKQIFQGAKSLLPFLLCTFGLRNDFICCCSQECFLLWSPARSWAPEGAVKGCAVRLQPLGPLRPINYQNCVLEWIWGFWCTPSLYLEGQIDFWSCLWKILMSVTGLCNKLVWSVQTSVAVDAPRATGTL